MNYDGQIFTTAELVSFGKYLLSDVRETRIVDATNPEESVLERLQEVYHADICNWMDEYATANQS